MTIIFYNKSRIKRLADKARREKTQLAAFAVWLSLSALCLTILICAGHAISAISGKASGKAQAAIAAETGSAESGAPEKERHGRRGKRLNDRERAGDERGEKQKGCDNGEKGSRQKSCGVGDDARRSALLSINNIRAEKPAECDCKFKCKRKNCAPRGGETASPAELSESETAAAPKNKPSETTASETRPRETAAPQNNNASPKPHNWYCKNNDTHARPTLPPEFGFLKANNGYWLGGEGCGKVIYLTFDAGYENGNVAKILDILKAKQVVGAFFVLDNLVRRNPELVKRMSGEGHLVCNHTAHHKDMTKLPADEFNTELTSLENAARECAGVEISKYYRPPCGTLSERDLELASRLGYKTVMWSYAYADWDNNAQMRPEKALEKLIGHIHEGMVLLLHPTSSTNAQILGEFVDRMTAEGWRFGKLDELAAS